MGANVKVLPHLIIRTFLPLFLGMPVISSIVILYILFNPFLWGILLLYSIWYYYDKETPWKGSRASRFVRNLKLWKYCGEYFDAELVKTTELSSDHNYIFACHPHGAIGIGTILSFGTEATELAKNFPGLKFRLVTLPINFYVPLHREIFTFMGLIPSDAESIEYALNIAPKGRAVTIVPGGAEEAMDSHSHNYDLTLKDRKGFVKLAIKNGASLVPVYNFGENKTYHQLPNERGSFVRKVQTVIKRATGISPILVCGAGFFNNHFGIIPKSVKITTVVGSPIHTKKNPNPTKEEVDNLHNQYVESLIKLFEDHKLKYDVPEHVHLRILDFHIGVLTGYWIRKPGLEGKYPKCWTAGILYMIDRVLICQYIVVFNSCYINVLTGYWIRKPGLEGKYLTYWTVGILYIID